MKTTFRQVTQDTELGAVFAHLNGADLLVVDTETNGLYPYDGNRIIGVSIYEPVADIAYYFPIRHLNEWNLSKKNYAALLWTIARHKTIMFNAKFDLHMLGVDGMKDPPVVEDVLIAAHILNENEWLSNGGKKQGAYTLKRLARKYIGQEAGAGEEDLIKKAKALGLNPKSEMYKLSSSDVSYYAMMDVVITWQLREFYMKGLERWKQVEYYYTRCRFQSEVLLRMERNGMLVSVDLIKKQLEEIDPELQRIQAEVDEYLKSVNMHFGTDDNIRLNMSSPQQLMTMFELMGHPLPNTRAETLKLAVAEKVPLADLVLKYRQLSKEAGTYYRPYLELVNEDGVIHHTLVTTGAETGRISSQRPNMQQIPRKGKYKVKKVFVVREGYALIQWDYRQLELRLATYYANERKMQSMFNEGVDLHQWTADRLNISRDLAKTYNFGLLYGMGAKAASIKFSVPFKDAITGVEGWHALYPSFRMASNVYANSARQYRHPDGKNNGDFQYIRLFNGKVRHYQEYKKYPEEIPPYKDAWNVKIQGTAAAILELSLIAVMEKLPDNDIFRPINQIHDALMAEVRLDKVKEVIEIVNSVMTDWTVPPFNPKLEVEASLAVGKDGSWYNMEVYNPDEW